MGQVWLFVLGFHHAPGFADGLIHIAFRAFLLAGVFTGGFAIALEHLINRGIQGLGEIPLHAHSLLCFPGFPVTVCHHGDTAFSDKRRLHASHGQDLIAVKRLGTASVARAAGHHRVDHARQLDINAVNRGARGLGPGVQFAGLLADVFPFRTGFERHIAPNHFFVRQLNQLAITQGIHPVGMKHPPVVGTAVIGVHPPNPGGGHNHHQPGRRSRLPQGLPATRYAGTAAGQLQANKRVTVFRRYRGELHLNPGRIHIQFFRNQGRQAGIGALPHFNPGQGEGNFVLLVELQPDIRRPFTGFRLEAGLYRGTARERQGQYQTAGGTGADFHKITAVHGHIRRPPAQADNGQHRRPPIPPRPQCGRRCRSGTGCRSWRPRCHPGRVKGYLPAGGQRS